MPDLLFLQITASLDSFFDEIYNFFLISVVFPLCQPLLYRLLQSPLWSEGSDDIKVELLVNSGLSAIEVEL